MSYSFSARSSACAAALLLSGNAAFADVTPKDVWTALQDQMAVGDATEVTFGAETMAGDTLTVVDIVVTAESGGATTITEFGTVTFSDNGDGTVTMVMPEEFMMTSSPTGNPDTDRLAIKARLAGNSTVVSGSPDAMGFHLTADRYAIEIVEAIEAGAAMPFDFAVNINNIDSTYTMTPGDLKTVAGTMAADGIDMFATGDEDGEKFDLSGQAAGISMTFEAAIPAEFDTENPADMFEKGYAVKFDLKSETSNYLTNVTNDMGATAITSSGTGGGMSGDVNKDGMSVKFGGASMALGVTGGQIPFPVDLSMGEYGMSMAMPLTQTDEPAPFSTTLTLTDLAVNDQIWTMLDPAAVLPHDPATLQIDLSGTAKLTTDIMNQTAIEEAAESDAAPGELHSLSLNALKLAIAGALVTGTGDFTFDNADLVTFAGMPRPQGEANFQANGVNGLMDKLVQMGLVPEEQIMGARMMMGMFTTVVGDDQLAAKIEVTESGQVLANGQRIR